MLNNKDLQILRHKKKLRIHTVKPPAKSGNPSTAVLTGGH